MVSGLERSAFNTDGKLAGSVYFPVIDLFKIHWLTVGLYWFPHCKKPHKFSPEMYGRKTSSETGKICPNICWLLGRLQVRES